MKCSMRIAGVTLAATLAGFGVPPGVALLGVASFRLVNFWLPIPVGAAAYLSLRVGTPGQTASEDLEGLAEEARQGADAVNPWVRLWRRRRALARDRGSLSG